MPVATRGITFPHRNAAFGGINMLRITAIHLTSDQGHDASRGGKTEGTG